MSPSKKVVMPSLLKNGPLRLVLRISRVAGLAPLVFEENRVRISKVLSIYGKVLITIINVIELWLSRQIINHLAEGATDPHNMVPKEVFFTFFEYILSTLITFLAAFMASGRMKIFLTTLKRVEMAKNKLGDNGPTNECNKKESRLIILYYVTFTIAFYVQLKASTRHDSLQKQMMFLITMITIFSSFIVLTMVTMQIILTGRYISSLFPNYNKCLRRLLHVNDDNIETERAESAQLVLHELTTIYTEICEVVDTMNHHHNGITMFFILTTFTITLMITSIRLIQTIQLGNSIEFICLEVYWMIHHFCFICLIIDSGHRIIYETTQIKRTVSKLIGKSMACSEEFVGDLNKLFYTLMLVEPAFCPLGVFTLSRGLIISIIGAALTYSVIVVQLG